MMKPPNTYSAKEFLHKFHKFKEMTPNRSEWAEKKLTSNPPRYYRFLELKALMSAFNIGNDLEKDFLELGFLQRRNPEELTLLNKAIQKYALHNENESTEFAKQGNIIKHPYLRLVVRRLFQFSAAMRKVFGFNSGVIEAGSITFRFAIHKTQSFLNDIDRSKLEEIETLICSIIAPKNQSFSRAELIEQFDFPDVNLWEIDMEWI